MKGLISLEDAAFSKILPSPSCAKITLSDIPMMDASSHEIATKKLNLANVDLAHGIEYSLVVRKLVHGGRRYSIDVTVNVVQILM